MENINQEEIKSFREELLKIKWPIVRYQFNFTVTTPIHFPPYAGSTIRGAFGRALRRIACMTKGDDCKQCPLYKTCVYTKLFETPAPSDHELQKFSVVPTPYVIEPPAWGEKTYRAGEQISFNVNLFGQAVVHNALVIFAMKRAFAYDVGHGTAQLTTVNYINLEQKQVEVYVDETQELQPHQLEFNITPTKTRTVVLEIFTPLRLQNNSKPLGPKEIQGRTLLMALVRRISLLMEFHQSKVKIPFSALNEVAKNIPYELNLKWKDWTRYSSRQKQKMSLGGVVGEIKLFDVPDYFLMLLEIGQWMHVGKNASFGLGKYRIKYE